MIRNVVTNMKDLVAISSSIIDAAQTSIVWCAPSSVLNLFVGYGVLKSSKTFLERGGSMRGVTEISPSSAGPILQLVQAGAAIHHAPQPLRAFMLVGDARESISSLQIDPERISLAMPLAAFWTDDATYAAWLLDRFEAEWTQSVDGEERMRELSKR
jgi:hypothetical protein